MKFTPAITQGQGPGVAADSQRGHGGGGTGSAVTSTEEKGSVNSTFTSRWMTAADRLAISGQQQQQEQKQKQEQGRHDPVPATQVGGWEAGGSGGNARLEAMAERQRAARAKVRTRKTEG